MPTVADLVRPGTALPGIADRMQIRGFCARWHPIVIAAEEDDSGLGLTSTTVGHGLVANPGETLAAALKRLSSNSWSVGMPTTRLSSTMLSEEF
jgi:hypothetical protein